MEHLTPEQNAAFDAVFATLASPGWKFLQRELESMRDTAANVRNCKNLDFSQGQLSILDGLANWKSLWDTLYAGAKDGSIEVSPDFAR